MANPDRPSLSQHFVIAIGQIEKLFVCQTVAQGHDARFHRIEIVNADQGRTRGRHHVCDQ